MKPVRISPAEHPLFEPFSIHFSDALAATAVLAPPDGDPLRVLRALGLLPGQRTIFVSGGASGMEPDEIARTRPLIADGLARFAEVYRVAVIDGGTSAGVMKLIGDAYHERGSTFPLIGVAPIGAVRLPGDDNPDGFPLDDGHTHFVFVQGEQFGDESDMIARLAVALAHGAPLMGLIINGGEIGRQETYERAVHPTTAAPLLVIEGSGRFGDELAQAARGIPPEDTRIREILNHADVRLAPADAGPERFYAELERLLG